MKWNGSTLVLLLTFLGGCCGSAIVERDLASSEQGLLVPPKYEFVFYGWITPDEMKDVREHLPYERIELEVPAQFFMGEKITLWRDGRATFAGWVPGHLEGPQHGEVSIFDYGRLCYLIDDHGLLSMEDSYPNSTTPPRPRVISDLGIRLVRVWLVGEEEPVVVSDRGSTAPIALWAIQTSIRGVAQNIRWEKGA